MFICIYIYRKIRLKGLFRFFRKIDFFILWLTLLGILVFEVEKLCQISAELTSFLIF